MKMIPHDPAGLDLLQRGTLAFAEMEANGVRIDVKYLERTRHETANLVKTLAEELEETEVVSIWRKKFGNKFKLSSADQLREVLYREMGFVAVKQTETGKDAVDSDALDAIDDPFVKKYQRMGRLAKADKTFLKGIAEETVDGFLHADFSLNGQKSFRGASRNPNLQNMPNRDREVESIVRSCFIPRRRGWRIIEVDVSGAEVRVGCAYHKDPTMMGYMLDPKSDMHRDMAIELFKLKPSEFEKEILPDGTEVTHGKRIRFAAKSGFVFAEFYGSYYKLTAAGLWKYAIEDGIVTRSGRTLVEHLLRKGITELGECDPEVRDPRPGTFEAHVREVERKFWGERFREYGQWRKDVYANYQRDGYTKLLSGFVCTGYMNRKDVSNYPVQGASSHCVLWCQIRIMAILRKRKLRTKVWNTIHDSILFDGPAVEVDEVLAIAHKVMTVLLPKHYTWLNLPMVVEAEATAPGEPWSRKSHIDIPEYSK